MNETPLLSPEDHAHFLEQGYVVVKNAVPSEIVADAVRMLDNAHFEGEVGAADFRHDHGDVLEACITPTVHQAIAELFGPEYPFHRGRGATDMPRVQQPVADWPLPRAHVDDDYPHFMPAGWAVGMFLFLTPVQSHGGAFVLFPGSPRRYQLQLAHSPGSLSGTASQAELSGTGVEFLAQPGDLLLFHHLFGHTGSNNVTDPRTRHALLARWHPHRRIVPGDKPLESMSTIEKANSVRCLHKTFGTEFAFPLCRTDEAMQQVLTNGLPLPQGIITYTVLLFQGVTTLLFNTSVAPEKVQAAQTQNWAEWTRPDPGFAFRAPIRSLHVHQRGADAVLLMSDVEATFVSFSDDIVKERYPLALVGNVTLGFGHYNSQFGSKVAHGRVLFFVPTDDSAQIRCRWAGQWKELDGENPEGINEAGVAMVPTGGAFVGFCVYPTLGESRFALVADVRIADETRPYYALSGDSASYPNGLTPLPYDTPTPPRHLRAYARARDFWLVTYLRPHGGGERIFLGRIDWQEPTPTLREIRDTDAWCEAFAITGMA